MSYFHQRMGYFLVWHVVHWPTKDLPDKFMNL